VVAGLAAGSGTDRLSVGIGMIPRGEVGLIFASIGKGLGVVTDAVFSAVVIMVIVTTLITPLGLKWSLFRASSN
jgi:Kef-type K+ transport system membrane component KefB